MKKYAFILLFPVTLLSFLQSNAQKKGMPSLGVCTSYENDSVLAAAGFQYIEESARRLLAPMVDEATYQKQLRQVRSMKLSVPVCNLFLPNTIRLIGPEANEKVILGYVDSLMQRAKDAGVAVIVLGSSGSRRLTEGMDREQSIKEMISIVRKMAVVAGKYGRIIAMENLNTTEDNFITTLSMATDIAAKVDHPNFRITADIYHMLKEAEDPASIVKAAPYLVHCHIAERDARTAPGKMKDNFVPYFKALKQIGYKGRISVECRWESMKAEAKPAHEYLVAQLETAYK